MATMMRRFQYSRKPKSEVYGRRAEVKTFYENVVDTENAPAWVEWAPPAFPQQKRTRWEGFAIQEYRKCDDLWDPLREQNFSLSFVRLLSPFLRDKLRTLLEPYGVVFNENYAQIDSPLQALFCERDKIQNLHDNAEGQEKEHFAVLMKLMRTELGTTLNETEDLLNENKITHRLLWTLFPKGTIVARPTPEGEQIYQCFRATGWETDEYKESFYLFGVYVRFDGVFYGTIKRTLEIPFFSGRRDIPSLPVFPIEKLDGHEEIRQDIIARGTRLLKFQDVHYMRYHGTSLESSGKAPKDGRSIVDTWDKQGQIRVMIDFQLSRKRESTQKVERLGGYSTDPSKTGQEPHTVPGRPGNRRKQERRRTYDDEPDDLTRARGEAMLEGMKEDMKKSFRRLTVDEQERNRAVVSSNEEDLLLLDPYLDGFSLTSKTWQSFNIERLDELDLNSDAFDFLVHPDENKSLVCAVVDNHVERSVFTDDVIAGKGQGLLILLSGKPGTGKTLMAEAIADKTKKPLYYVDSRDLGEAAQIERFLSETMTDAAAWNAILLLDEADIYLHQRSGESLSRNKIVAVFLRLLEYYKGIMFLTTNLWELVDEAIESRIQIHLRFPDLDRPSRLQIWQNFLARSDSNAYDLAPDEIDEISKWVINGRQIRNVLRMAAAWSRQIDKPINMTMLDRVVPASCPKSYKESTRLKEDGKQYTQVNGAHIVQNGSLEAPSRPDSDLLML